MNINIYKTSYIKKQMTSVEYFTNEFMVGMWDSAISPSLYENNNMDKKISAFIETKAEIQELLARQPEKKNKIVRFYSGLLRGC